MKKLTAIALCVVFLLSVFVVGIFGMQTKSYNVTVTSTGMVFKKVELSTGGTADIVPSVDENGNVIKNEYDVIILTDTGALSVDDPLRLVVDYSIEPANVTSTKVEMKVINENAGDGEEDNVPNYSINEEDQTILVTGRASFTVTFRCLDTATAETYSLNITVKKPRPTKSA